MNSRAPGVDGCIVDSFGVRRVDDVLPGEERRHGAPAGRGAARAGGGRAHSTSSSGGTRSSSRPRSQSSARPAGIGRDTR